MDVNGYHDTPGSGKPYVCPLCKGRFRNSSDLRRHEKSHGEVKQLQCSFPNCSFATNRRDSLRLHEKTHTGIEGRLVHPCVMCGKKFSSEQIAIRHRKTCGQDKQRKEMFSSAFILSLHRDFLQENEKSKEKCPRAPRQEQVAVAVVAEEQR